MLYVGILCKRADMGLMRIITNDSYGGLFARRLLVAAIAVPLVLAWLILQGQSRGYYDPALALSLDRDRADSNFCRLDLAKFGVNHTLNQRTRWC